MQQLQLYRYFLALPVPRSVASQMVALRESFGLTASPIGMERLHMTLCLSDDYPDPQPMFADRVERALADFALPECTVSLDTIAGGHGPVVLLANHERGGVRELQRLLSRRLASQGISAREGARFSPHVTLAYDRSFTLSRAIDPIGWTPDEVMLVESWVGRTQHHRLGSWDLGTAPAYQQASFGF